MNVMPGRREAGVPARGNMGGGQLARGNGGLPEGLRPQAPVAPREVPGGGGFAARNMNFGMPARGADYAREVPGRGGIPARAAHYDREVPGGGGIPARAAHYQRDVPFYGAQREVPGYEGPRVSRYFFPRFFYQSPEVYYARVPAFHVGIDADFRHHIGEDAFKCVVITNDAYDKVQSVVRVIAIAAVVFTVLGLVFLNPPMFSLGLSLGTLSFIMMIFNECLNKRTVCE